VAEPNPSYNLRKLRSQKKAGPPAFFIAFYKRPMRQSEVRSDHPVWRIRGGELLLDRVLVMGIVNVTPDSFADGGRYFDPAHALTHARQLIDEGADIIDIGGESTRPGAAEVSSSEEIGRVLPLLEALAGSTTPLSVDTSKPEVMRAALAAGAAIINDVRALQQPGAAEVVAEHACGVVLMHMQGAPATMQQAPYYRDVTKDVVQFLAQRVQYAQARGIDKRRIAIDPGFGFGKNDAHNFTLLAELSELERMQVPIVVGLSRKATLGRASGRAVQDRASASVAAAVLAAERGANVVRVHDVAATRDALSVLEAMRGAAR
jgi:dihydropteroate synthase